MRRRVKNLHIEDSYKVWKKDDMKFLIDEECYKKYKSYVPYSELSRTYESMYIEWWLHNIGYYITKPFCFIKAIRKINSRCKDVDLESWL